MAKYTVTFPCGHTEEIQLFGKHEDRYRKIEYFEKYGLCSVCREEKRKQEWEERKASVLGKAGTLPILEGTENQVAWAESIRAKWLIETEDFCILRKVKLSDVIAHFYSLPADEKRKQLEAKGNHPLTKMAQVLTNSSAKFFIENR